MLEAPVFKEDTEAAKESLAEKPGFVEALLPDTCVCVCVCVPGPTHMFARDHPRWKALRRSWDSWRLYILTQHIMISSRGLFVCRNHPPRKAMRRSRDSWRHPSPTHHDFNPQTFLLRAGTTCRGKPCGEAGTKANS